MNAPRDTSYDDYLSASLKDPSEAAAYIEAVIGLDDPAALLPYIDLLFLEMSP